jgi:oxygen-independent coproporphyrinogen-3 oxidase
MGDDVLQRTLDGLLGWGPEHVSAYQLSVGEDSALAGLVRSGRYEEMADEDCAGQYGLMCRVLSEAGFSHYEISNWALPGWEALHNSGYWKRLPYVGLGPGAHSFRILPGGVQRRSWNMDEPAGDAGPSAPAAVSASVASSAAVAHVAPAANPVPLVQEGSAAPWLSESEDLSPEDIRVETVMLARRTAEGIPETALRSCCDPAVVDAMLSSGLLSRTPLCRIRIPEDRFFVSEAIIRDLL